jgi:release factor glutamine methyltransferase
MNNSLLTNLALIVSLSITTWSAVAADIKVQYPGESELIYLERKHSNPPGQIVKARDKYLVVFDGVTPPSVHSMHLLDNTVINEGDAVLDIGTGSGIQAIFAAEKASRVVATDIDPGSVENAEYNVQRYELQDKINIRLGDLFKPIDADEKFDVIIINLVYPYNRESQGLWEVHRRFFAQVRDYLKPDGRIYYQAGLIDNIPSVKELAESSGLLIMKMDMINAREVQRQPIVFMLQPK